MGRRPTRTERSYSYSDKYAIVGNMLRGHRGTVLDVGARDRALVPFIDEAYLKYYSADLGEGHDFAVNLEEKLSFEDKSYDFVVALDVLEHVERIHQAFQELARVARLRLIISLPNMTSLPRRWSFLWTGRLGTAKYDLCTTHQGDRHRWVTAYRQMNAFVEANAQQSGFVVKHVVEELEPGLIVRRAARTAARLHLLAPGLLTGRCIYDMARER